MRFRLAPLFLAMALCATSWGQHGNSEGSQQQKPTLGPAPAPSLYGPHSSTTTDPAKLLRTRAIFIEPMDNGLSDKLEESLAKWGRFRVVASRNEADAVLRGSCMDSRRLKSLHSEIFLNDRRTGSSIWQDNVHQPFNPPVLSKAVSETARVIVYHLTDSVSRAQNR